MPRLFHGGLSATLTKTLSTLASCVPDLVRQLRLCLLDAVCLVLTDLSCTSWLEAATAPHVHLCLHSLASHQPANVKTGGVGGGGAANGVGGGLCAIDAASASALSGCGGGQGGARPSERSSSATPLLAAAGAPAVDDSMQALLTHALETLSSFDMRGLGPALLEFVRACIVPYLDDMRAPVRISAAVACCRLLAACPEGAHPSPDPSPTRRGGASDDGGDQLPGQLLSSKGLHQTCLLA